MRNLCLCGCGRQVTMGKRYRRGHHPRPSTKGMKHTGITPEDIAKIAAEGYTTADAAHLLGIDRKTLWKYRKELEVSFPNSGVASWIHRRGYCG
jgi:DNA-binding CsgD family transcriptional regulator